MASHAPTFPENRFAENRSPDPNDVKNRGMQGNQTDHDRTRKDSEVLKKPRRFTRKDVEQHIPPDSNPNDPVAP